MMNNPQQNPIVFHQKATEMKLKAKGLSDMKTKSYRMEEMKEYLRHYGGELGDM